MQKEESTWDKYRETLASLEKEWRGTSLGFMKDRAALAASYGGIIPSDVQKQIAEKETEAIKSINKKIREESNRFANQIQVYDFSQNPSRINEEPKKESALEKTPDGVPKSPLYSKFIGDYQPAPSKEPSPPAKSKDEERER